MELLFRLVLLLLVLRLVRKHWEMVSSTDATERRAPSVKEEASLLQLGIFGFNFYITWLGN